MRMTCVAFLIARMLRTQSAPSSNGISTSMTTTLGFSRALSSTAAAALSASPTISMSPIGTEHLSKPGACAFALVEHEHTDGRIQPAFAGGQGALPSAVVMDGTAASGSPIAFLDRLPALPAGWCDRWHPPETS